jgi:hypothetical protein
MYQKYSPNRSKWRILKLALHTMLARKYGGTNPMMPSPIYGHLDVLFIKCAPFTLHFKEKIFRVFTSV